MRKAARLSGFLWLSLIPVLVPVACCQSPSPAEEAFRQCAAATQLDLPGAAPFALDVTIQYHDAQNKSAEGRYLWQWASPAKWRKQVQIGNYRRTDFGDEGGYWHADPLPLRPLQIKRLEAALDPCSTPVEAIRRMNLQPGQVKKIQRREAVCYRAKAKDARNTSFCFDRASYVLLQRKDGDEFDFFDYQPIGVKMLPARITWKHESWAPIEFRLSAVTPSSDLATYVREPGMAFSNTCADPVVPRVTDHREPEFSMEARRNYTQGSLWIAALIDESGKVTEDAILKHLPDGLDEEALRAVKLWRFKPAMCPGDKPTPYEIEVEVSFRFGT